jgi:membrane protein CcdC involved in cytochrome C biogenesis
LWVLKISFLMTFPLATMAMVARLGNKKVRVAVYDIFLVSLLMTTIALMAQGGQQREGDSGTL